MKRILITVITLAGIVSLAAVVSAQNGEMRGQYGHRSGGGLGECTMSGPNFIDQDGDGVCDNSGVGIGVGIGIGSGSGFVDVDQNGVCDNADLGYGKGNKKGKGLGRGSSFVDADQDGVCDNAVQ